VAQKSATQLGVSSGFPGQSSGEILKTSGLRSDRSALNRKQRREQLKQNQPTVTPTPQPSRRRRTPRKASNNTQTAGSLPQLGANRPKAPIAALKPARTPSTEVRPSVVPTPLQTPTKITSRRQKLRPTSPLVYGARLLILGVGLAAIAGTLLSAWDPSSRQPAGAAQMAQVKPNQNRQKPPASLPLAQEIVALKSQVQALATKNPKFKAGMFFVDLDTGAYLNWEGDATFSSASTIKLPVLVALFQDVDAGKIRLDEKLTLKSEMIGDGSGDLQYQKPGTQLTALETAIKMITISDNTATNMLIARLGGAEVLNQRFRAWGLTATAIHNALPDLEGTNTTSPKELASLMAMVNQGELVSLQSRDRMLDIMRHTITNSLLPRGLGKGATIAHKTGDIGSLVADVGLIDMPIGKRYIAAVMVKRPHNDPGAQELIRQLSQLTYQYFSQPVVASKGSSSASTTPGADPKPFITGSSNTMNR